MATNWDPMSDTQIIQRIAAHPDERDAGLPVVLKRNKARIWNRVASLVGEDPDEVKEGFQRTSIEIWKYAGTLKVGQRFVAWLLTIIGHVCADILRRRMSDKHRELPEADPAAGDAGPDERVAQEEAAQLVRQALSTLPDDQREVLTRIFVEGQGVQEIADDLGIGLATVVERKRRGLRRLKEILGPKLGETE